MADQPLQATVVDNGVPRPGMLADWLRLLRVPHWTKNGIVFPALLLAGRAAEPRAWQQAAWAFAAFCLASSSVYALNDVLDCEADRLHPTKRRRPLAAGQCGRTLALSTAVLLALSAQALALWAPAPTGACVLAYLVLNLAYSLGLKHLPVVDACCIAAGFALRLVASLGAPGHDRLVWLLLASTFLLCFSVAVAKRAADLQQVSRGQPMAPAIPGLDGYTGARLRWLLPGAALATTLVYALFAWVVGDGALLPLLTVCPVAYSLVRLSRLSLAGVYAEQIDLARSDFRLLASALVWLLLWAWIGAGG